MLKFFVTFFWCCSLLSLKLTAQLAQRFDVVIDEVLSDPTPQVSLPNAELVELKNTSGKNVNLQGWRLSSLTTKSAPFPLYVLPADSFLIISSTGNSAQFAQYGRVLGISSFPSLSNAGTMLSLTSKEGLTIHSVNYNNTWFKNDVKSNGGWSLEMIDTKNPCTGYSNWKASTDPRGGTPAAKNAVDANNPDNIAPVLVRAFALDSVTVEVTFSEPLDSSRAAVSTNYSISEGIGSPIIASVLAPSFVMVKLRLQTPLTKNKAYVITANNITDCSGNIIEAASSSRLVLASDIDSFEIVINEILFNPKQGSTDYVEIYNRSNKPFNLRDIYIANRSSATNALGKPSRVTNENILFFPGDFFVLSENKLTVMKNYYVKNPDNLLNVAMPSFPDDKGVVVILNAQGKIIDELHYSSKWHFALIDNQEGISLERIDYNKPTENRDNWTSASSTSGFGTPTYQNSQIRTDLMVTGEITITPKTFSPDNDGLDDFTNISIRMADPGYVANITIFDAVGRPLKYLVKNATLGATGSFRWDGLDDKLHKVPVGVYVVYTEVFNLSGKKRYFKNTVVVASKF